MNDDELLGIGSRRITVSTAGLPKEMLRFSRDFPQMRLAVSLHAATDELRQSIMPIARKYPLEQLLEACRQVSDITNKLFTFEYVLLPKVNDREEDVAELARITASLPCKINLLAYNPVAGQPFRHPSHSEVESFQRKLLAAGCHTVIYRRSHGADVAGACGQLAASGEL